MSLFENRKFDQATKKYQVPIWFMRQAGRYHQHYQNIKKTSHFMEMCKSPKLAAEITMGPIQDFDFDAAILFSDLLFPLEQMGMGLNYLAGPPQLDWHLQTIEDLKKFKTISPSEEFYDFQKQAMQILKNDCLPQDKTLLGFVGAPFTLYTYAVEGSHAGNLVSAKKGLYDGRFEKFLEFLLHLLLDSLKIQAQGGADALCLFDTAAGELSPQDYKTFVLPSLRFVTKEFKKSYPHKKIIYYSKHTQLSHLHSIQDKNIDVLGIDWRHDLSQALQELGKDYFIQGNIDPCWLHLPWKNLEQNLTQFYKQMENKNLPLNKWIFGLGHGVLIETPEENVKKTVELVHRFFRC